MKKIQIVIPVLNRYEITKNILESLKKQTFQNFDVILVDSGSTDETPYLNKIYDCEIIKLNISSWWTHSVYKGVEYAKKKNPDYILIINDDIIIDEDFLNNLYSAAEKNNNAVIVPSQIDNRGNEFNGFELTTFTKKFKKISINNRNERYKIDVGNGCAIIIPTKVINEIDLFAPDLTPHYGGDLYIFLQLYNNNVNVYACPWITIKQYTITDPFAKLINKNIFKYPGSIFHTRSHYEIGKLLFKNEDFKLIKKIFYNLAYIKKIIHYYLFHKKYL